MQEAMEHFASAKPRCDVRCPVPNCQKRTSDRMLGQSSFIRSRDVPSIVKGFRPIERVARRSGAIERDAAVAASN